MKIPSNKLFTDLTGDVYGRLTVDSYGGRRGKLHQWNCTCECGARKAVYGSHLRCGGTKSCGCLKRERATTHGGSGAAEYVAYKNMLQRCYNEKGGRYPYYGDRGITVCSRWRDSPENFLLDMGSRPTPQHSLDRIDNDGNYSPDNCRWATKTEQMLNRRRLKTNSSGVTGVHWNRSAAKWQARIGINGRQKHLGLFTDKEEAIAARALAEEVRDSLLK